MQPTYPMTSPCLTVWPSSAPNLDWWAYIENRPLPCEISVWLPYGPPVALMTTIPAAAARIGVPLGAPRSTPVWHER